MKLRLEPLAGIEIYDNTAILEPIVSIIISKAKTIKDIATSRYHFHALFCVPNNMHSIPRNVMYSLREQLQLIE